MHSLVPASLKKAKLLVVAPGSRNIVSGTISTDHTPSERVTPDAYAIDKILTPPVLASVICRQAGRQQRPLSLNRVRYPYTILHVCSLL